MNARILWRGLACFCTWLLAPSTGVVAQIPQVPEESIPPDFEVSALVDLDGDGDLDSVGVQYNTFDIDVLWNDGGGRFSPTAGVAPGPVGRPAAPDTIAVADFNGDGLLDVMYRVFGIGSGVALRFAVAPGVFSVSPAPVPYVGPATSVHSLSAMDVDLDGDVDVLIGTTFVFGFIVVPPGETALWLNDGNGVFTDATAASGLTQGQIRGYLHDFDGDGLPDALGQSTKPAVAGGPQPIALKRNLGGGTFGPLIDVGASDITSAPSGGTTPLDIEDLDLDGLPDLLVAGPAANQLQWIRQTASLVFVPQPPTSVAGKIVALAARDLDGDLFPEIVVVFADRTEVRRLTQGLIGLPINVVPHGGSTMELGALVPGDVDQDGDVDMILCDTSGLRRCLFNDGAAGLVAPYGRVPCGDAHKPTITSNFLAADLDGDGDRDWATFGASASAPPVVVWSRNDGEAAFGVPETSTVLGLASYAGFETFAAFDSDGDGDDELLCGAAHTTAPGNFLSYFVVSRDASGGFGVSFLPGASAIAGRTAAAGDFDLDGDVDVVVGYVGGTSSSLRFLNNDGAGGFSLSATIATATRVERLVAADLDGDGDLDVTGVDVLSEGRTYLNQGAFSFIAGPTYGGRLNTTPAAGDFDADGDVDVICGKRLLRRVGASFASAVDLFVEPFGDEATVVADVDSDGDKDVVRTQLGEIYLNDGLGQFTLGPTVPGLSGARTIWFDGDGDGDLDAMSQYFRWYSGGKRGLQARKLPRPGYDFALDVSGPAGGAYLLAASTEPIVGGSASTPFGRLVVDPSTALIFGSGLLDGAGRATASGFLPSAAGLPFVGFESVLQAIVDDGVLPRLTNARTMQILSY